MDKEQAIHSFWSSFGIPAYDENTVPTGAAMPYITYAVRTGALDDALILPASLWYKGTSWAEITKKAHEIAEAIGRRGHLLIRVQGDEKIITDHADNPITEHTGVPITMHQNGGYLYITQGTPFAQRMTDPDDQIRRIYINLGAEFFTAY